MAEFITPEDFQDEIHLNWKQGTALFIVILFGIIYLAIPPFKEWFNLQVSFILDDWQLLMALVMIVVITIGYYLLQLVILGVLYLNFYITSKLNNSKVINIIRYIIVVYFLSVVISYFAFDIPLEDLTLWGISLLMFFAITGVCLMIFGFRSFLRKTFPEKFGGYEDLSKGSGYIKEPSQYLDIKMKHFLLIIISVFLIIYGIYAYLTNLFGFQDFITELYTLITSDSLLKYFFYTIIVLTLLWKPIIWLSLILCKLASVLVRKSVQKGIRKARFYLGSFAISVIVFKNIPYLPFDDATKQILNIVFSIITAILSMLAYRYIFRFNF